MSRGLKSIGIFLAVVLIFSLSHHKIGTSGTTTTSSNPNSTTTTYASTCAPSDLTATFISGQGAGGTIYGQWAIAKNSGANCVLYGYAIATYQDSLGAVLPIHVTHTPLDHVAWFADAAANKAPQLVPMHVGSVAHIDFSYTDVPIGNSACPTVAVVSLQLHSGGTTFSMNTSTTSGSLFAPCAGKTLMSPFF